MRLQSLILALMLISGCGGNNDTEAKPPLSDTESVELLRVEDASGPFVKKISLEISSIDAIKQVEFTIKPKPGSLSKPIHATYSNQYIVAEGLFLSTDKNLVIPIFGLYANYSNEVMVDIKYLDESHRELTVQVDVESFVDKNAIYDHLVKVKSRSSSDSLGYDYFYLKSGVGYPVVIDSDGEVRWFVDGGTSSFSSLFKGNQFIIGSQTPPATMRSVRFDGQVRYSGIVSSPSFTRFHHDLSLGKVGFLAELDAQDGNTTILESNLAEISASGEVLKQWNMSDIFRQVISAAGEDPSGFVRDGVDWFHMNSAIYDATDDSLIISSRENFVIKIDYLSGHLKWILGDETKHWYQDYPSLRPYALTLTSGLAPIGQHALSIDNSGNLMLFNNGLGSFNQPSGTSAGQTRIYSLASAYTIDQTTMTAAESWSFDNEQQVFSDICSSVYQHADGGYLISYAVANNRTTAKIVGLSKNSDIVFDYEMPTVGCNTSWNAQPIDMSNIIY